MNHRFPSLAASAGLLFAGSFLLPVHASTVTWKLAGDGVWTTGTNWTGNALPSATSDVIIDTNRAVTLSGANGVASTVYIINSGRLFVSNGATLSLGGTGSYTLSLDYGGALTATGSGSKITTAGGFVINTATVNIDNGAVIEAASFVGLGGWDDNVSNLNISNGARLASTEGLFLNEGATTVTLTSGGTYSGYLSIGTSGTFKVGTGGVAGVLDSSLVENKGLLAFNHSDNLTFAGSIFGAGTLTKSGTGILSLTGANTYNGGTTVTGGTLQIGNGGTNGSIAGNVAVSAGASLAFKRSNNLTYSGVVSGAGSVVQNGTGVLTLSGTNTHTGGTTINSGTLSVSSNANLGNASGGVTLAGGDLRLSNNTGTDFNRAVTVTADSGVISNRGSGTGAGVNHTLGTLSIGANTLSVTRGPNATSGIGGITFGATTLTGNATFNVASTAKLTLGSISGSYGFTKSGTGNLTLTGINTHTGLTAINAGTLALGASATLADTSAIRVGSGATFDVSAISGGFTLASGQTLGGTGSVSGLVNLASGARIGPGNSPGTLTFTGGLNLGSGSILDLELGTSSDLIRITAGTLSSSGTITVNLSNSGGFTAGTYTLINATGATLTSISATSFTLGQTIAGYDYTFSQTGNLFQLTATAVPEPSSFAALASLFTLAFAATRRRRRAE